MTASWDRARAIADAVLYEGYLLYPYRATSSKNQSRWQFGVLGPPGAADAGIGEDDTLSAQFLVDPAPERLTLVVRFLQLQRRRAERDIGGGDFEPVDELTTGVAVVADLGRGRGVRILARPARFRRSRAAAATWPIVAPAGTDDRSRRRRAAGARAPGSAHGRLTVSAEPDGGSLRVSVDGPQHRRARGRQGRGHRHLADRHPRHRRGRRRGVRLAARTAGRRRGRGVTMQPAPLLPGARRPAGRQRSAADLADHPLRPPGDRRTERRRAVRLHRDRRDPHPAGHDDDRRGEGAGPRHRPAGGADHRPVRLHVTRGDAAICTACCAIRMPPRPRPD